MNYSHFAILIPSYREIQLGKIPKMQKRPDFLMVLVIVFGLGVLLTGVNVSQARHSDSPIAGQMPGVVAQVKP